MSVTNSRTLYALFTAALLASLLFTLPAQSATAVPSQIKELNFVFLHGLGANASAMQRLQDAVADRVPAYARAWEQDHPDTAIRIEALNRSYPNDVEIADWAKNLADDIEKRFPARRNLVLVGHSMGGKVALYAVANNIGGMADKTAMVATINSPVKGLQDYYYVNGKAAANYWELNWLVSGFKAVNSLVNYDSSKDGQWVARNRHWLALVSAESAPMSAQFNASRVDPLPRDMDDVIVPISAQYAEGADVLYYGEYGHGDFTDSTPLAGALADQILRYIFNGNIQCSALARAGTFEHKADLFPGVDHWEDVVGGLPAGSGTIKHVNDTLWWKDWEDVVGNSVLSDPRSNFEPREAGHALSLSGIIQSVWVDPGNSLDGRLRLHMRAPPRSSVQADWVVFQQGLLPAGILRDHYEVEIVAGNPLADITHVTWETDNPRDLRLRIRSQAESPFRQYSARWRVYFKENRQRDVIGELPARAP
jgi:pimeloyl-ACP methyl ester carboxylesterase